jgi:hypothetical protein
MRRKSILCGLIGLQMVGTPLCIWLSVKHIESILASGPIFSLVGIAIAVACYRFNLRRGFYFGLAAPTVSVLCFALICGLDWSPSDARRPIPALLILFALFYIPAGFYAFAEAKSPRPLAKRPIQFTIASLLWTTLAVSIFLSACRVQDQALIALLALAGYGVIVWYVVSRFRRNEGLFAEPDDAAPERADDAGPY